MHHASVALLHGDMEHEVGLCGDGVPVVAEVAPHSLDGADGHSLVELLFLSAEALEHPIHEFDRALLRTHTHKHTRTRTRSLRRTRTRTRSFRRARTNKITDSKARTRTCSPVGRPPKKAPKSARRL